MEIKVENIKCGGCVSTLQKKLLAIDGVDQVSVDIQTGTISIVGNPDRNEVISKLDELGYPEVGNNSLFKKSKSMVSCVIGRLDSPAEK